MTPRRRGLLMSLFIVVVAVSCGAPTRTYADRTLGLRFRYPADWRYRRADGVGTLESETIVTLSNKPIPDPCVRTPTGIGCVSIWPSRGTIWVGWSRAGNPRGMAAYDGKPTRIAGRRAKLDRIASPIGAPPDVSEVHAVIVDPKSDDNFFEMWATIRGPDVGDRERQVFAMLRDLQIYDRRG